MRLTTSSLAVGKARGIAIVKHGTDEGTSCVLVDQLIIALLVENVIETILVMLQELGQIHLIAQFVHEHRVSTGYRNDVDHLEQLFAPTHRTLSYAHGDLLGSSTIRTDAAEGIELQLFAIGAHHERHLPIGIAWIFAL